MPGAATLSLSGLPHSRLWKEPSVLAMEKEFKMQRVRFDGCALGLKSSEGAPIYKPWAFSTNCPAITLRFAKNRCDGRHVHLKELSGKELRNTGFYTPSASSSGA
jgi:hypothetical protein